MLRWEHGSATFPAFLRKLWQTDEPTYQPTKGRANHQTNMNVYHRDVIHFSSFLFPSLKSSWPLLIFGRQFWLNFVKLLYIFLNFKRQAYFLIYKVVLLLTPRSHRKVNANKNDKNNNKNNNIHIITYKMKISRPYV